MWSWLATILPTCPNYLDISDFSPPSPLSAILVSPYFSAHTGILLTQALCTCFITFYLEYFSPDSHMAYFLNLLSFCDNVIISEGGPVWKPSPGTFISASQFIFGCSSCYLLLHYYQYYCMINFFVCLHSAEINCLPSHPQTMSSEKSCV